MATSNTRQDRLLTWFHRKRQYVHRFLHIWKLKKYKQNATPKKPAPYAPELDVPSPRSDAALDEEHESGKHTLHHEPSAAPSCAGIQLPVPTATVPAVVPHSLTITADPSRDSHHWVPQLNPNDNNLRHSLLADILFALGDTHYSCVINTALWNTRVWTGHTATFVRAAQTQAHALIAQRMIWGEAGPSPKDDSSWHSTLSELLLAHTCNWVPDAGNGNALEKTQEIVRGVVLNDGQEGDRLRMLSPRGPHLDLQAYIFLRSTLTRYNSEHRGREIDTPGLLQQFLKQQRALLCGQEIGSFPDISCLPSCLKWCTEALGENLTVPPGIRGTVKDPAAAPHAVLCTLLLLRTGLPLPSSPSPEAATRQIEPEMAWEDIASTQLGISGTELLSTVVCMIMAALPKQDLVFDELLLNRALAGAKSLSALSPGDLVGRFLNQVWATNRQLMAATAEEQESLPRTSRVTAELLEPFRRFAAESLGVDGLPMLEQGIVVYPIVLADPAQDMSLNS